MSHVPGQEHPSLSHHFQNMVQGLGCSKAPPHPYNIAINIARAEDTNIAFIFQGELYFGDPPFLGRNLWGEACCPLRLPQVCAGQGCGSMAHPLGQPNTMSHF